MSEPLDLDAMLLSALSGSADHRDLYNECKRQREENARLRATLRAIVARIDGEWDNPDLLAWGPLAQTHGDIRFHARAALAGEGA